MSEPTPGASGGLLYVAHGAEIPTTSSASRYKPWPTLPAHREDSQRPFKAPSLKPFPKHSGIGGRREQANTETSAIEARSKSDKVLAATLHEERRPSAASASTSDFCEDDSGTRTHRDGRGRGTHKIFVYAVGIAGPAEFCFGWHEREQKAVPEAFEQTGYCFACIDF